MANWDPRSTMGLATAIHGESPVGEEHSGHGYSLDGRQNA
jgi:hypothetical protein